MTPGEAAPARVRAVAPPLLLFVAVFLVYLPSVRNGFIYDDHKLILGHPGASTPSEIAQVFRERHFPRFPYYRPITRTTLLVQKALHGDHAAPFHAFNAALMGLAALAAYALLRSAAFAIPRTAAALAALLFTVHPVASTCVYPICSGRETLMPALVMMATMAAYLRGGRGAFWLAQAGVAVALFCKEQAIVLPVLLFLADALGLSRRGPPRRVTDWLGRYGPMAAVVAGYALVRHQIFGGTEYQVRALADPLGPLQSFLYAFQVLLVPFVRVVYEPVFTVWASWPRALGTVALLGVLACVVTRTRTPSARARWFWLAWFVLPFLPTANLLRQEAPFAERYVFLSSLALFAVAAAALARWVPAGRRGVAIGGTLAVAAVLAAISITRGPTYRSDEAFARQWIATNPDAYEAHFSLGSVAVEEKRDAEAREHFETALRIRPEFADAHVHLARIEQRAGQTGAALEHVNAALRLHPDDPMTLLVAGQIFSEVGRTEDAITALRRCTERDPTLASAWNTLGVTYCRSGRIPEGIPYLEEAVRRGSQEAVTNLRMARQQPSRD